MLPSLIKIERDVMQIESYNLPNLPSELVKEIISHLQDFKTYTALACCTIKFNEMARAYSIISWPIKVTRLIELKEVTAALHHLGCNILAVNQIHEKEGADERVFSSYVITGSVYELTTGKQIGYCQVGQANFKNLESKFSKCMEEESVPYLTDSHIHDQPCKLRDETRKCDIKVSSGNIKIVKEGKETRNLRIGKSYIYSEKRGYLIYEKGQERPGEHEKMLIVLDVDSGKIAFSHKLKTNETFHRFIYNEESDHLVFSSDWDYGKHNIYEVSSGKLLKRFTMNNFFNSKNLLLYLPKESLIVSNVGNTLLLFDLKSEKLARRIYLKDNLPIEQLSFRNHSLYITQVDDDVDATQGPTPNCITSKIDFYKAQG